MPRAVGERFVVSCDNGGRSGAERDDEHTVDVATYGPEGRVHRLNERVVCRSRPDKIAVEHVRKCCIRIVHRKRGTLIEARNCSSERIKGSPSVVVCGCITPELSCERVK